MKVPKPPLNVKLDGISLISNIEYNVESLRVWKAYGIGPGKETQLKELGVPQSAYVPDLVISGEDTAEETPEIQFIKVKSRLHRSENAEKSGSDVEDEPATDTSATAVSLFSCPEEGCVKTYQRFSSLQASSRYRKTRTCFRARNAPRQSSAWLRPQATRAVLYCTTNAGG